ncbi:hypothetical protein SynRS9902_01332 [Synechococcus sp. RS9902]|nr:hypothetical protein SynRS9902_01332 [Synechococcus sp. RS9902]
MQPFFLFIERRFSEESAMILDIHFNNNTAHLWVRTTLEKQQKTQARKSSDQSQVISA